MMEKYLRGDVAPGVLLGNLAVPAESFHSQTLLEGIAQNASAEHKVALGAGDRRNFAHCNQYYDVSSAREMLRRLCMTVI
jgi:hypothetical protein